MPNAESVAQSCKPPGLGSDTWRLFENVTPFQCVVAHGLVHSQRILALTIASAQLLLRFLAQKAFEIGDQNRRLKILLNRFQSEPLQFSRSRRLLSMR